MENTDSKLAGFVASIMDFFSRRPDTSRMSSWTRTIGIALLIAVIVMSVLSFYWSREPKVFWVNSTDTNGADVTGYATADALAQVLTTLLEKPGGFLHNDVTPPSVFLDNMPNFEYGAVIQARDLIKALRNDYARSQSQSMEDPDLAGADPNLHYQVDKWILPSAESGYREGLRLIESYRDRISDTNAQDAQFFARADNLREWLIVVEKRLGGMSQALTQSVGRKTLNTDLAGDPSAVSTTPVASDRIKKTPWHKVDDIFFEARGTAWALVHFLRAAELDFSSVLEDKNATVSLRQIIRELEASLEPLSSPIILNGGGYGTFANHSLVMASYLSRANSAVINLRELLDKG
ncbi:MAG: DUF2333 family protein [Gammaproteobacteria bacterium]